MTPTSRYWCEIPNRGRLARAGPVDSGAKLRHNESARPQNPIMIDIHSHLLPYIDDGAADWHVALGMARVNVEEGVTEAIVTPHWAGPDEGADQVLETLAEYQSRLQEAEIPLVLHPGNELILVPEVSGLVGEARALSLAGTSYLLLETAQLAGGPYMVQAAFSLRTQGYQLVLAHPERAGAWQEKPDELEELVRGGCHLQINAGSLLGEFGRRAQRTAELLLQRGWVTFLASDAHGLEARPPGLRQAVRRAAELMGEPRARQLVEEHPRLLLQDRPIYLDLGSPPTPPRRPLWRRLLGR